MIQWILAIWSLVPLPFLNPLCTSGSSQFMYCWSLAWRRFELPWMKSVPRRLLWSFGCVMFPWFFMFLEVSNGFLHTCNSNHPSRFFTSWLWERKPFGQCCQSETFPDLYGYTATILVAPPCGRIFKLVCLPLILRYTRPGADSLHIVCPSSELKLKFVVSPWPADSGWLSTCAQKPSAKGHTHHHQECAQRDGHRVAVWVGEVHGVPGVRRGRVWAAYEPGGGTCRQGVPSSSRQAPWSLQHR